MPNGKKPPPAVKLTGSNVVAATTVSARNGTTVFQITTKTLLSDMNFAPAMLIPVNSAINPSATSMPVPFSSLSSIMLKWSCTQPTLLMYWIAAIASIGAMNTACSHDAQPAVKPAIGPCE